MQHQLVVSSSPFMRDTSVSTKSIMRDVVLAMLPTAFAAVWFFGLPALSLMVISVLSCMIAEFLFQKLSHQKTTVGDWSAAVTGLLLAFNLPASAPWWIAVVGSVIAIVLIKQMFGGIGQNFMNPALAARTILMLSWAGLMAANVAPDAGAIFGMGIEYVDAVSTATPLASSAPSYSLMALFMGDIPGMLGETCKLTLILGGVWLIWRRIVDWRIPVSFIGTAFVLFYLQTGVVYSVESGADNALYQLMSGGLMLGAFFMATDYATCPIQKWGRVIMGVGCAVILFAIRAFSGAYPEGCSFAILFMNLLTPLIDKWTTPKTFGYVKPAKANGGAKA